MDYEKTYGTMHKRAKAFAGYSILGHADAIALLVYKTGAGTLLDYGSGKGFQYLEKRVHMRWGGILPVCYDPGVRQLRRKPEGVFDGVICTDVMEHIEEADVDRVLEDVIGYASRFVFFNIACRPAKRKTLPDGRNVHLTIKPPEWWDEKIAANRPHEELRPLEIECAYDERIR